MANRITILQFGIGKFIKGYFDWLLSKIATQTIVYGIYFTQKDQYINLKKNSCVFSVILKGRHKTQVDKVETIKDIFYIKNFQNLSKPLVQDIDIVVSNTTEKGILDKDAKESYPLWLMAFLFEKYKFNINKKITIIPLELINRNGQYLKERILDLAVDNYGLSFKKWVVDTCEFVDTIVDCIVTKENSHLEIEREDYYALYLSKNSYLEKIFSNKNLNIYFTNDIDKISKIKIKVLNGIHTFLVCTAFLEGKKTVFDSICDEKYSHLIEMLFFDEILPTIDYDKKFIEDFYYQTLNRFKNPNITHNLEDIALNTYEKFYERLGKTILDYQSIFNKQPKILMLAFENLKKLYPDKENLRSFNKYMMEFQK